MPKRIIGNPTTTPMAMPNYDEVIAEHAYLIGNLGDLYTDNTDNLVDAVNEIYSDIHQEPLYAVPTTLEANAQYNLGERASLSLSFPTMTNDGDVIYLTFKSGATPTTLTIDTTNTCDIECIPEANTGYEIFAKFVRTDMEDGFWIVNYSEYTVSEV